MVLEVQTFHLEEVGWPWEEEASSSLQEVHLLASLLVEEVGEGEDAFP